MSDSEIKKTAPSRLRDAPEPFTLGQQLLGARTPRALHNYHGSGHEYVAETCGNRNAME